MIIVFDLETTGLLSPGTRDFARAPGITQLGALKLDRDYNEIADPFVTYVDPEIPELGWSDQAMEITGITPDTVKGSPSFMTVGRQFAEYVLGCGVLAGYNICDFDVPVMALQLMRYGLQYTFPWPIEQYDVMRAANKHFNIKGKKGSKNPKLGEAYQELFGREFEGAHDALSDIRATVAVMKEIKR